VSPANAKKTSAKAAAPAGKKQAAKVAVKPSSKPPKAAPSAKKPVAAAPKASKPPKATPKAAALKAAAKAVASASKPAKAAPKAAAGKVVKAAPKATPKGAPKAAPAKPEVVPKPPEANQPTGSYNGIRLAESVKPFPKKTPYTPKEIETLRKTLVDERDQLLREMTSLNNTNREVMDLSKERPGYSMHLAEHATDLQTAEASMGVQTIVRDRLEEVETAIKRIDDSNANYGLCLACGSKIGIQRLMARPHAHLCMDCRQQYERIRSRRG
jgi:RNA polymerase-binding transcription factor DksA